MVRLHAAVKKETLESTIATLTSQGILDLEGSEQTYVANAQVQRILQKLIDEKAAILKDGPPSSYQGVLCTLNCRLMTQITPQVRRHMIPLLKGDVEDLDIPISSDADPVFKWWGRLGAVGVPTYDGTDITGFWILTQKGSMHLPLVVRKTTAGFGCVPSMADPAVFIVDTIEDAVRLTIWSAVHQEKPIGFVVPVGVRDTPEHYSAKRVIYWSATDDAAWILRSRHCPQNLVMLNKTVTRTGVYPFDGDFPRFMHEVELLAMPAYAGIAKYLMSLPHREAVKAVSSEPMEPAERSKISAHASGEDARLLLQLLSAQAPLSVDWSGFQISETPNGWTHKGRVISSAMFYLSELRPFANGVDALVTGSVVYGGRSVAFQEKLSVLRRNPATWLENFAVQKFGVIVYIEKPWRPRLLEISQRFRSPTPIMPGQRYGWDNHALRMPLFIVDGKDITPSFEVIEGPLTPLPAVFTEAEKDAFNSPGFCSLFLILLKNLIQTESGVGSGWALTNEPHVVERTAHALGLRVQHDPTDAVVQSQRGDPIMHPTVLNTSISRVVGPGTTPNMLVSLDRLTASLAHIFYGWPSVSISSEIEYPCLRGVFFALQALLTQPKTVKHYRELANVVEDCFGIKGALHTAGFALDLAKNHSEHSVAVKLITFMVAMHKKGQLPVTVTEKGVVVSHADFYALTAGSPVQVPNEKEISHSLALAKFIVNSTDKDWTLLTDAWYFHAGFHTQEVATR
jgi:hypothetical protein